METGSFENFPLRMVLICNLVGLAIYGIGIFLMAHMGVMWGALYAAYCIWVEWRILSRSCRSCYYFGKRCGFGRGLLCSWFFTKRTEQGLSAKQISWRDVVPDFLVSIIPLTAGIIILIRDFSWLVLLLVITLACLGSMGTALIRGQITCKYCKQHEFGCQAEQLFSKIKQGR